MIKTIIENILNEGMFGEVLEDFYLPADAFAHSIDVQLKAYDIDYIKTIVHTAPTYVDNGSRWLLENKVAYLKGFQGEIGRDFEPILDGRDIDLKY